MTDKKIDSSQDERARTQTPVLTTPASKRVPPQDGAKGESSQPNPGSSSFIAPVALVISLAALGLSGLVWQQSKQAQESQRELLATVAGTETAAGRTAGEVQTLANQVRQQASQISSLENQLGDASAVIKDLDEALRIMTDRGSELVLLNDIDHLVTIAQQQLQLGGNVRNAIVALESAQAQLARANRPALAMLLQTLNGDLDRLRAASTIDIAAFSQQLEELAVLVTEAPLIMPDPSSDQERGEAPQQAQREQPAPTSPPSVPQDQTWWREAWDTTRDWSRSAWDSLREDLGQFIEVRRVDDASALLMSPDQASRFRDNLRTRIMTAQLALMMRQPEVWATETEAVVNAIQTRYDENSPLTRKALRMARNMADTSIDANLPTVDNTLQALSALREEQSQKLGVAGGPESNAQNGSATSQNGAALEPPAQPETNAEASQPSALNGDSQEGPAQEDQTPQQPAQEGDATQQPTQEGEPLQEPASEGNGPQDSAQEDARPESSVAEQVES